LVKTMTSLGFAVSFTSTLMRFLAVKGSTSTNSYTTFCYWSRSSMKFLVFLMKLYPMSLAKLMKQTSSGLLPWNSSFVWSLTTSWQMVRESQNY